MSQSFPTSSVGSIDGCESFVCSLDLRSISKELRTVTRAVEMPLMNRVRLGKETFVPGDQLESMLALRSLSHSRDGVDTSSSFRVI